jgi:DNA-binding transcriptional LysR family regulator
VTLIPSSRFASVEPAPRLRWLWSRGGRPISPSSEPELAPAGFTSRRLAADRLWLACASETRLATSRRREMPSIAAEPLVGYAAGSSTMRRVMAVLGPLGSAPWIEVDGKAAALAYVEAGLGIAFVSAVAPDKPARTGVAVRDVTAYFEPTAFWLVWREGAALPPLHRRLRLGAPSDRGWTAIGRRRNKSKKPERVFLSG